MTTTLQNTQMEDITDLLLDSEIQESLVTVLKEMPKIAKLVKAFGEFYDIADETLSDPAVLDKVLVPLGKKIEPLQEKVRDVKEVIQEAKQRAEGDTSKINVFSLMKLLKDPTVQKNLRFVQAALNVLSERGNKTGSASI